jgi:hypothetical protein
MRPLPRKGKREKGQWGGPLPMQRELLGFSAAYISFRSLISPVSGPTHFPAATRAKARSLNASLHGHKRPFVHHFFALKREEQAVADLVGRGQHCPSAARRWEDGRPKTTTIDSGLLVAMNGLWGKGGQADGDVLRVFFGSGQLS